MFHGSAGAKTAEEYFLFDGASWFTQQEPSAGTFLRVLGRQDIPFTVEAWVYRGPAVAFDGLFGTSSQTMDDGVTISVAHANQKQRMDFYPSGVFVEPGNNVAEGVWLQVVYSGRPDGVTTGKIYLNGNVVSPWMGNNNTWTNGDSTQPPALGAGASGAVAFQSGSRMAIVRIYGRVLTDQEVAGNFAATRGRFGI